MPSILCLRLEFNDSDSCVIWFMYTGDCAPDRYARRHRITLPLISYWLMKELYLSLGDELIMKKILIMKVGYTHTLLKFFFIWKMVLHNFFTWKNNVFGQYLDSLKGKWYKSHGKIDFSISSWNFRKPKIYRNFWKLKEKFMSS